MAWSYTPKYYFDEGLKRYVPWDPRPIGDLELDFPWEERVMIRERRTLAEVLNKHHEPEAREVIDYAKIGEAMTFATKDPAAENGRGPDIVLEKGRIVEVMKPTPYDRSDIEKKADEGIQLVTIRWRGKIRLVHATMLFRSSESAFRNQAPE